MRNKKTACTMRFFDGDNETRTHDLLNAIQALSQLSYAPMRLMLFSHRKEAETASFNVC